MVRKLADGNCWMVQNLRLAGAETLTPDDTDVVTDFVLPASATSAWGITVTATDINIARLYNSGPQVYYNWYTATAGSGTYEMSSGDAPYSICPKNWRLPVVIDNQHEVMLIFVAYNSSFVNFNAIGQWEYGGYTNGSKLWNDASFNGEQLISATAYSNRAEYATSFDIDGNMYANNSDEMAGTASAHKAYGRNIRCLAR